MQIRDHFCPHLNCFLYPLRRRAAHSVRSATAMPALFAVALAMVLAGCTVGPNFVRPIPQTPAHWSRPPATPRPIDNPRESTTTEETADLRRWWADFNDPMLSSLIEHSMALNLDLRAAVLRIDEARAQRGVAAASLWPSVSGNASYTRTRISETTATGSLFSTVGSVKTPGTAGVNFPNPYNQYQLGADISWEVDLVGRVRRSVEVADANIEETVEDQHAALVALLGDVAQSYIELRGAQLRKATAEQSIATTSELLELARKRRAAGLTSEVDVVEATAQMTATRAQWPAIDLAITQAINQLSRLLGREPEGLRAELDTAAPIPPLPAMVPIGFPADLARRRPDIRKAEASLHAATADIGVAVAGLFPRITFTGSGGFQSETVVKLMHWASRFVSIGPTLELPMFDLGRWKTVRVKDVRAKEAAVAYAATVLNALHEVENARAAYGADQDRRAWLDSTVAQNRDAWQLARQRYDGGVASFIEVLDAERTLQQNQLSLAESRTAVGNDLVRLYRALGGGWESMNR
jgi:NodT family efflux transporter outer membrane factor (OMF) lipoprotein